MGIRDYAAGVTRQKNLGSVNASMEGKEQRYIAFKNNEAGVHYLFILYITFSFFSRFFLVPLGAFGALGTLAVRSKYNLKE